MIRYFSLYLKLKDEILYQGVEHPVWWKQAIVCLLMQ